MCALPFVKIWDGNKSTISSIKNHSQQCEWFYYLASSSSKNDLQVMYVWFVVKGFWKMSFALLCGLFGSCSSFRVACSLADGHSQHVCWHVCNWFFVSGWDGMLFIQADGLV